MSKRARGGGGTGGAAAAAASSSPTIPLREGWQTLPPGNVLVGYFPNQLSAREAAEARRVLMPPQQQQQRGGGGNGGNSDNGASPPDGADNAVGWAQHSVRVFGREHPQPRLVSYCADHPGLSYTYSGLTLKPRCWAEDGEVARTLRALRAIAERACRSATASHDGGPELLLPPELRASAPSSSTSFFNSCLLNLYRDGRDAIGWHADNEPLFGPQPVVASVSLGARRDFYLRRRQAPGGGGGGAAASRPRYWCPLGGDGDVLVMAGAAQEEYLHAVPARKGGGRAMGGGGGGGGGGGDGAAVARVSLTFRRVVSGMGAPA